MAQKKCIWIVEDDVEVQRIIELVLSSKYNLIFYNSFQAVKDASSSLTHFSNEPDMFLLDLCLPDGTGFQVIKYLKSENIVKKTTPIVFLTSNDSISSKLLGFELGARDYICKPIEPLELKARVDVINKVYEMLHDRKDEDVLSIEDLEINFVEQSVYITKNSERVPLNLTYSEYKLLVYFIKKPNILFNREQLLDVLRGESVTTVDRSVDVVIYRLRRKLGLMGKKIKSVYGGGYRFDYCPNKTRKSKQDQVRVELHA